MNNYKYDKGNKTWNRKAISEFPLCEEVTLELFEERFMPRM